MTTPTPNEMEEKLGSADPQLVTLTNAWAQQIFQEQFQGDALIDGIEELLEYWGWLDEDDPEATINTEVTITDEVWSRITIGILDHIQSTRRRGR